MPTISFTIPTAQLTKLNTIAQAKGFPDTKRMIADMLRQELISNAIMTAKALAAATAEAQAKAEAAFVD